MSVVLAKQYLPYLDALYKKGSCTAVLDSANSGRIRFKGGNKVELFKTDLVGLGDYSRANGFVKAQASNSWEELTLSKDRGISLTVDSMDNEETLDMLFGTLASEFYRQHLVPELDAYRFAAYASASNILSANADITVGSTDVPGLIATAQMDMGDNEVPEEGRVLFVSEKCYAGLKAKITRYLRNEGEVNKEVEMYDGMQVVRVPQGRFNTAITLNDGSASYGFAPTAGGYKINFMIVHPSAVAQIVKHEVPRIWMPNENIDADAFKFDLRCYHDAFVLSSKTKGVYLHRASTANT